MEVHKYIQVVFVLVVAIVLITLVRNYFGENDTSNTNVSKQINETPQTKEVLAISPETITSDRAITVSESVVLSIRNIVASSEVKHSIPIEAIRKGCGRQDCIPSVDTPKFISTKKALEKIVPDQIGIALSYKNEERFYPFSMLVTKELVNDVVGGDPLLVSYCPLCGTGIVFDRSVDGTVYEFGVSGMLWQSNLLMYNRSENINNRNLWSQVLGEAVVGERTGTKLKIIPSDIMQFKTWATQNENGVVLDTGSQRDPYNGNYYGVAQRFAPDFDLQTSQFSPDMYVYGIEVNGVYKAYPRDLLPEDEIHDMINDEEITIVHQDGKVKFIDSGGITIGDVEGFWFSWVAAHPETLVWSK